jgi:hypothetical protein
MEDVISGSMVKAILYTGLALLIIYAIYSKLKGQW